MSRGQARRLDRVERITLAVRGCAECGAVAGGPDHPANRPRAVWLDREPDPGPTNCPRCGRMRFFKVQYVDRPPCQRIDHGRMRGSDWLGRAERAP